MGWYEQLFGSGATGEFYGEKKNRSKFTEQEWAAFCNACDCLYYGVGTDSWNNCGLDESNAKRVWHMAFEFMAEDF